MLCFLSHNDVSPLMANQATLLRTAVAAQVALKGLLTAVGPLVGG
jgi:hypothetical protein